MAQMSNSGLGGVGGYGADPYLLEQLKRLEDDAHKTRCELAEAKKVHTLSISEIVKDISDVDINNVVKMCLLTALDKATGTKTSTAEDVEYTPSAWMGLHMYHVTHVGVIRPIDKSAPIILTVLLDGDITITAQCDALVDFNASHIAAQSVASVIQFIALLNTACTELATQMMPLIIARKTSNGQTEPAIETSKTNYVPYSQRPHVPIKNP